MSYLSMYMLHATNLLFFFFFNDPSTTEIYTLSLHDALPISRRRLCRHAASRATADAHATLTSLGPTQGFIEVKVACARSEEHTSELQSRRDLVCRLLLEKKKNKLQHVYEKN